MWVQYCQHLETMKLLVHLDSSPSQPASEFVKLSVKEDDQWVEVAEEQMYTVSSTVLFKLRNWPRGKEVAYKLTSDSSEFEGVFRAEPDGKRPVKMLAISCLKDIKWPWQATIDQMIKQDPDLVYFSGDQIYENDYGSPAFRAKESQDVAEGMDNYLEKYRQFGKAFRDLLKDRPCIMITDDHDVFANDLWGNGGKVMNGDRTTGGFPCHPNWVNAAELTQTGMLPQAHDRGPHGDGILAYYTSLDYGGIKFAILEDRKFKSPPSEVISKPILGRKRLINRKKTPLEVVRDPDFDCRTLDREDLHLLGTKQEAFLADWSKQLKKSSTIGAVLSQSPWAHVAMYTQTSADLDSNGWPQSGRNRALKAIGDAPVVMIHGDVHLGTLLRHGTDQWEDGPISYSLPPMTSHTGRSWKPLGEGENRAENAPQYTGRFHDRFGNKMTVHAAANGQHGYGMVIFDPVKKSISLEFHPLNENREPVSTEVEGWPFQVSF